MFVKEISITAPSGVHTRFSAMIVNKAAELKSKYKLNLYIQKSPYTDWLGISMLAILSLKIVNGEVINIGCKDDSVSAKFAVLELSEYIEDHINNHKSPMEQIDKFIEESKIANDQIFQNCPIGILVIDLNYNITNINDYALNLLAKTYNDVLGKPVEDIIPNTELKNVMMKKNKQYGQIQHINKKTTLVNRSPICMNDKVIGAVSVFQDVSEVVGIKELNEKFTKILESSHDMICFVDEHGKISYINPAYARYFPKYSKDILGKDIFSISPNGYRAKVLKDKKILENILHTKDGVEVITTVDPIFIDGDFKGVISTSKPINELKEVMKKLRRSEEELKYYRDEFMKQLSKNSSFNNIIGYNSTLKHVIYMCSKASESTSTVLVRGESGTGKELIAQAIHNNSDRKNSPFVRVNCAAIPENLLESELFGYEKGAFTGANKSKPGKFAIADGGTIFLDEIGDMPLSMQVKLLRVLQEREVESLGGLSPQKIDVRVIAATNRNLEEMMKEDTFREDLYYRLNVLSVNLPPLRDRKEDLPVLIEHFIEKLNKKLNKDIKMVSKDSLLTLQEYSWPGNIRELENIIERAVNLCASDIVLPRDLPPYISGIDTSSNFTLNVDSNNILPFEEYEKQIIEAAMKKYKSFNKAGKALGLTHRTISLKCKKYNIDVSKK